jgi:hypothetical protein
MYPQKYISEFCLCVKREIALIYPRQEVFPVDDRGNIYPIQVPEIKSHLNKRSTVRICGKRGLGAGNAWSVHFHALQRIRFAVFSHASQGWTKRPWRHMKV